MTANEYNKSTQDLGVVQYYTDQHLTCVKKYFDAEIQGDIMPINRMIGVPQTQDDSDVYLIQGYNR